MASCLPAGCLAGANFFFCLLAPFVFFSAADGLICRPAFAAGSTEARFTEASFIEARSSAARFTAARSTAKLADRSKVRIGRPAITLDLNVPLVAPAGNREAIAEAACVPGIYRSFLIWRQKYAHLVICDIDLCNGSCINYGDACLVCAQSPVLPELLNGVFSSSSSSSSSSYSESSSHACSSHCAPSYVRMDSDQRATCCLKGECP